MIAQAIFFFNLYLTGVSFSLLFRRQLPVAFLCFSGFFWGTLGYVILALFFLMSSIPYTLTGMAVGMGVIWIATLFLHVRMGTWRLASVDLQWLGATTLVFIAAEIVILWLVPIYFTPDSYSLIKIGRWIGTIGFQASVPVDVPDPGYGVFAGIADYGVFVPVLQSAGVLLGVTYLSAFNPLFALFLAASFVNLGQRALAGTISKPKKRLFLSLLIAIAIFSDRLVFLQSFYLHTNLVSTVYLFLAVVCFWLALTEKQYAWLVFAILSLTGFNLTRTEAPLFAIVLLILVVCEGRLPSHVLLAALLPFCIFSAGWYIWLSLHFSMLPAGTILNPISTMIIAASIAAVAALAALARLKWLENNVLPRLPLLMIIGLALVISVEFILKPSHMDLSLKAVIQNLFLRYGWGVTWYITMALLVMAVFKDYLPYERLFTVNIACFFMLVIALAAMRIPYRFGWADSANRMMTHILPVIYFFFLIKFSQELEGHVRQ